MNGCSSSSVVLNCQTFLDFELQLRKWFRHRRKKTEVTAKTAEDKIKLGVPGTLNAEPGRVCF